MAAHIGIYIMRKHEFEMLMKIFRPKLGSCWWLKPLAIVGILNATFLDLQNVAHHGGTVTGILMTLTLLNLHGVYRVMSLTLWILACLVWIRISSSMDQPHELHYPPLHSDNEFNDTLSNNVTDCEC